MAKQQSFKKYTLIERTAMTFESFLTKDYGRRFYSDEFLSGIAARKLETTARIGKAGGGAFIFATVLAFFDLISGKEISYGGLTLQITKDLTPIISMLAAGAMLQAFFAFIDDQILHRILIKIGSQVDIQSFPLLLVDKMALNLWSEAIVPRYFGEKSGRGQHVAMGLISFIALTLSLVMYAYPAFMVTRVFVDLVSDPDARWIGKAIATLAFGLVLWATALGVIFLIRFKFYPADWIESSNQPTEDFVKAMQEKIAMDTSKAESIQDET